MIKDIARECPDTYVLVNRVGTFLRLHVFVVMTNQDIPATNNGSERALRPAPPSAKSPTAFAPSWGAKL
jgi:hypothetical protein